MFSCAQQQQLLSQPQLLLQLLPQFQLLQPQPLPQPPQENRMMRMMMIQRPLLFPHIVPKSFLRTDECLRHTRVRVGNVCSRRLWLSEPERRAVCSVCTILCSAEFCGDFSF